MKPSRLPLNSMGKVFYRTNEGAVVFLNNVHNHFVPGTVSGTVMFLFVFTKVLDLAETVLIVLEGRKPLLIHIFHHVITLLFTWHSYSQQNSLGRSTFNNRLAILKKRSADELVEQNRPNACEFSLKFSFHTDLHLCTATHLVVVNKDRNCQFAWLRATSCGSSAV